MNETEQKCVRRPGSLWGGCLCEQCKAKSRRLAKMRRMGIEFPVARDAEAWAAMDRMLAHGWQPKAIAEVSGVGLPTIHGQLRLRREGDQKKWSRVNAERVIDAADRIDAEATTGRLSARGARRRLRALAALGWGVRTLIWAAEAEGHPHMPESTLHYIRNGVAAVTPGSAKWVADVYEAFWTRTPPPGRSTTVTVRNAARNGWAPPMAWDDIDDPDPAADDRALAATGDGSDTSRSDIVDEVAIRRCADGKLGGLELSITEREEAVRLVHAEGLSDRLIAARTGITDRTVFRIRHRLGLPANEDITPRHQQRAAG